jgi:hypothetical protein
MAIQMTKSEYEAMYGVSPYFPTVSDLDISVAPTRMTQEEYNAKYNPTEKKKGGLLGPAKEAISGLGTLYGGSEQGIASKLAQDVKAGAEDIGKGKIVKGIAKTGFRVAGDIAGLIFAPIGAAIQATGFNKLTDYLAEKAIKTKVGEAITDIPALQKFAITHPNAEEDFGRAMNLLMAKGEKGKIQPKTAIPRTIKQVKAIPSQIKTGVAEIKAIPSKVIPPKVKEYIDTRASKGLANDLKKIENSYSDIRKYNNSLKDSGLASRDRISQTDVLIDSVDNNGVIRTKQKGGVVDKYRKITIDGSEGIIRDNLIREGKKVNLGEVAKELTAQVSGSNLPPSDLVRAINGLKIELEGLRRNADELGNIELYKIHDNKISTNNTIDYTKKSSAIYKKAKARAYKTIVENKSDISVDVNGKKYNVIKINKELGKYYQDIERLEMLDGKRVKGGKLGKYSAQIAGNVAGAAVGGLTGGLGGMVAGTIVGGEVAGMLKGKAMERTFGKARGREIVKNPVLEQARLEAQLPPRINLKIADVKVGAPKSIPKTGEILKIEHDIAKNVEQQKTAIKAGDFGLVSALKEVYQVLVQRLKDTMIETIKNPSKEKVIKSSSTGSKGPKQVSREVQKSYNNDTTKYLKKQVEYENIIRQEADMLKAMDEMAEGGINMLGTEGQYLKTTEHSPAYREIFEKKGRAPSNADWLEVAKEKLDKGESSIGLEERYSQLKTELEKVAPQKGVETEIKKE